MKGSKREQKRLEAAEHVCRAVRKALSTATEHNLCMNIALEWLLIWIANSPAKVWQSDPIAVPRKGQQRAAKASAEARKKA